jgi:hypothetical protein
MTRDEETGMSSQVFRKTESGKAEIARRQAGLSPAARTVLVMVNGSDAVSVLKARGLPQLQVHLETLLALGLIEPVPAAISPKPPAPPVVVPPVPAPPPPASPDASTTPAPGTDAPADAQRLKLLQRQTMQRLAPHFGPDTPTIAQAVLAARTWTEYQSALDGIESKLAIYMGRKQAAREVSAMRGRE